MTDAVPADTPELERAHGFDSARLIARVRDGDEAGVREAYRRTFGHELGRVVLLHALAQIGGVGQARGPETPPDANHRNGRASAVLDIAGLAGFDPVAVAAAGLTQILEGADYEHGYGHPQHHVRNPAVRFGDEHDADPAGDRAGSGDLDAGGGDFGSAV